MNIAWNYAGRTEIVDAVNSLIQEGAKEITEEDLSRKLYTAGLPDPDLLIRTSGEMRVSNFLLWQIAYSELYVTSVFWPDFLKKHLLEAIASTYGVAPEMVAIPSLLATSALHHGLLRRRLRSRWLGSGEMRGGIRFRDRPRFRSMGRWEESFGLASGGISIYCFRRRTF